MGEACFHILAASDHLGFANRHVDAFWRYIAQFPGGYTFFGIYHAIVALMLVFGLALEYRTVRLIRFSLVASICVWIWYTGAFTEGFINANGPLWLVGTALMAVLCSTAAALEPPYNPATERRHER